VGLLKVLHLGYASWVGNYAERNAVLVDILESLGAVLFVKTNVPQTLMVSAHGSFFALFIYLIRFRQQWGETYNHVFGRTLNPHNRSLTPGGSSGGEGALIGTSFHVREVKVDNLGS
jgi:amidase